ncbi:Signal recognition particle protein [Rhizophlyctis rosea]|uniref:Signal recognition particle 9 kDa protein n=1 Tax=Rhizophlyctis rosea TaxID=64517 RepID=A0AAD5X7J2_9FUNG|nr:Signal recognition particle protein [Rhizophlyctis rosea]
MVYVEVWDDYQKSVEALYLSAPLRTRYVVKYRHCDGKLVLKVTDGPTCLKFRTDRLQDLKKFEKLNKSLMEKMQQRKVPEVKEEEPAATTGSQDVTVAVPTVASPRLGTASGGVGKKGKGKKGKR